MLAAPLLSEDFDQFLQQEMAKGAAALHHGGERG